MPTMFRKHFPWSKIRSSTSNVFFPIIGLNLPCVPEVGTKLTSKQLVGTTFEGENEVFMESMNKWILFFEGMSLPQGDVRTAERANLMDNVGVCYQP
jgi:hypothetical protein